MKTGFCRCMLRFLSSPKELLILKLFPMQGIGEDRNRSLINVSLFQASYHTTSWKVWDQVPSSILLPATKPPDLNECWGTGRIPLTMHQFPVSYVAAIWQNNYRANNCSLTIWYQENCMEKRDRPYCINACINVNDALEIKSFDLSYSVQRLTQNFWIGAPKDFQYKYLAQKYCLNLYHN